VKNPPRKPVTFSGDKARSKAQQNFKSETDINAIIARHRTIPLPVDPTGARRPIFGDIPAPDFHSMMNRVVDVQQRFQSLPARLRGRFNNDPYQLLRFTDNPANRTEALELGLVAPTEAEAEESFHQRRKSGLKAAKRLQKEVEEDEALEARLRAARENSPPKGGE